MPHVTAALLKKRAKKIAKAAMFPTEIVRARGTALYVRDKNDDVLKDGIPSYIVMTQTRLIGLVPLEPRAIHVGE